MGNPVKTIMIVEDNPRVREYLTTLLGGAPGFQVMAACESAEEALLSLERAVPDILLLDINLPGMSGIDLISELHNRHLYPEIVMLTMYEDRAHLLAALKRGASGYILKGADSVEILKAIQEVACGGAPMSPPIARLLVEEFKLQKMTIPEALLTSREREVLLGISLGRTNKSLAEQLTISLHTIQSHIKNIYKKLQVGSKIEAINTARRKGLL